MCACMHISGERVKEHGRILTMRRVKEHCRHKRIHCQPWWCGACQANYQQESPMYSLLNSRTVSRMCVGAIPESILPQLDKACLGSVPRAVACAWTMPFWFGTIYNVIVSRYVSHEAMLDTDS